MKTNIVLAFFIVLHWTSSNSK